MLHFFRGLWAVTPPCLTQPTRNNTQKTQHCDVRRYDLSFLLYSFHSLALLSRLEMLGCSMLIKISVTFKKYRSRSKTSIWKRFSWTKIENFHCKVLSHATRVKGLCFTQQGVHFISKKCREVRPGAKGSKAVPKSSVWGSFTPPH